MTFNPPDLPPRRPSQADVDECASKGKDLPLHGRDPCGGTRRKLDVLWHSSQGDVPVELKYRDRWRGDTYGYEFLKDLHRLERLQSVEGFGALTGVRFAVFVTCIADYWVAVGSREPAPFSLADGRTLPQGYWVQYDQPSSVTRWHAYPPFFLSNAYTFHWGNVVETARYLLVEIHR